MAIEHSVAQSARNPVERISSTEAKFLLRDLISFIGDDVYREGLKGTPDRIIRSWQKLFGGYKEDSFKILSNASFDAEGYDEMIMLKEIEFYSTCEHHMIPFFGRATVAYIPESRIVGISKLARVVEVFARRLQIQERMTTQITDAIDEVLHPLGVMVVLEAQHLCMIARGVEKQHSSMVTSAVRGVFRDKPEVRAEFFSLKGK